MDLIAALIARHNANPIVVTEMHEVFPVEVDGKVVYVSTAPAGTNNRRGSNNRRGTNRRRG